MTAAKLAGLERPGDIATRLDLTEDENKFLTDPYRSNFMTEFLIGSNKLKFYGYPLIMAKHSKFIESAIPILAANKPPYELFNFGQALEAPVTLIWLELNGFKTFERISETSTFVSLREWLQAYRLVGYLGIDNDNAILVDAFYHFWGDLVNDELDEIKEVLENKTDRDTIVKIINRWLHNGNSYDGRELFISLQKHFPDLLKELNYIPVKIGNLYANYANRAVINDPELFFKHNPGLVKQGDKFIFTAKGGQIIEFTIDRWGSDDINFNYSSPSGVILDKSNLLTIYPIDLVP